MGVPTRKMGVRHEKSWRKPKKSRKIFKFHTVSVCFGGRKGNFGGSGAIDRKKMQNSHRFSMFWGSERQKVRFQKIAMVKVQNTVRSCMFSAKKSGKNQQFKSSKFFWSHRLLSFQRPGFLHAKSSKDAGFQYVFIVAKLQFFLNAKWKFFGIFHR